MPINFPNSPSVGDSFTVGSRTWTYTGFGWAANGAAGTAGPPGPPGSTGERQFVVPTLDSFDSFNAGGGSIDNIADGRGVRITFTTPATNTNKSVYAAKLLSPGVGGWEAIARIRLNGWAAGAIGVGIGTRDQYSGASEFVGFGASYASNRWLFLSDNSLGLATATGIAGSFTTHNLWLKIVESAGTRYYYWSFDGDFWFLNFSHATTAAHVPAPSHVGVFLNPNYNGFTAGQNKAIAVEILSWEVRSLGSPLTAEHRYWRVFVTECIGGPVETLQIENLEMYESVGGPNILTGGTPIELGHNGVNDAAGPITGAYPFLDSIPTWLGYDFGLGVDKVVRSIKIKGSTGYTNRSPKKFTVEYSADKATWTTVLTRTSEPGWTAGEERTYSW